MTDAPAGGGLDVIFAIFLGLMVTAFIGMGVYTFYAPPNEQFDARIRDLTRQQESLNLQDRSDLTPEDRARLTALAAEIDEVRDAGRAAREVWGRNTSIVLIGFATLLMAISLVRADELPVISNGLLLGGVFTMVYGVGWIIATNTSISRFGVMTVALAITLALGYMRFAGRRHGPVPAEGRIPAAATGLEQIERRLAALEKRMDDAADALGRQS